jgi:hypothetical protein
MVGRKGVISGDRAWVHGPGENSVRERRLGSLGLAVLVSPQLGVFGFGLPKNREVWIGVVP